MDGIAVDQALQVRCIYGMYLGVNQLRLHLNMTLELVDTHLVLQLLA